MLVGCGNDGKPATTSAPISATPSATPPPASSSAPSGPKLSAHDTCVQVDGPVQQAVQLAALFSQTVYVQSLDPAPFVAVTAALKAGAEVAAPELAADLLIVSANAERMTKIVANGSTVHFEAVAFRDAALRITLACAKLGVIPPVPSGLVVSGGHQIGLAGWR